MAIDIAVYGHWDGLAQPFRIGWLHAHRDTREFFDFEFDPAALRHPDLMNVRLDPRLQPFEGRQYPRQGVSTFAVFADASPDRWGRLLMDRRFERERRAGQQLKKPRLDESDYLLGVHDAFRVGALRFRLNDAGEFLDNQNGSSAAPPFVRLRELQQASQAFERDENNADADTQQLIKLLIAPGGSLGGARPKATVEDPKAALWIAKFPSIRDQYDVGGFELIVNTLAAACGLRTVETAARRFAHQHHTFLAKRFDRTPEGSRLHFASAMTLTDRSDGDDASTGTSYLEIAQVLIEQGAQTALDLKELWSRVVFSMLVSNADDHLRNHGFIMVPGKGWKLSEAYDMNPMPDADGLRLNVSQADNAMDLDLARSVAQYFRVDLKTADEFIERSKAVVKQWRTIAKKLEIPSSECERMAPAFRLADDSDSASSSP